MKRKFLAWLMTLAMMFNMVMPYAAYADELPVDTDTYVSADGTDLNNDDEFNAVEGEPTVGEPSADDEQPAVGDSSNNDEEPANDEPAVDGNNDFTEYAGKEAAQAAVPMTTGLNGDEGVAPQADTPKYNVTCNVDYDIWVKNVQTTPNGKPMLQFTNMPESSVTDTSKLTYAIDISKTQNININKYESLKDTFPLDYVEIDGKKIYYSDFAAVGSNMTSIDTSACKNLNGREVKIRIYNGTLQIQFQKATNTITSDIPVKIVYKTSTETKHTLTATAGEHGSLVETKFIETKDGKAVYYIMAKPAMGYQLASYTIKDGDTVKLDLTDNNYRWNEKDNQFQIEIDKDTEITLNFTKATIDLQFWSHQVTNSTENWWNIDVFNRAKGQDGKYVWNETFENHKSSVPLIDDMAAQFYFKVNIKGYMPAGTEGETQLVKLYSGTEAKAENLLFDSSKDSSILNNPITPNSDLRGDRSGGFHITIATIPSDLANIYIEVDYAGYKLSGSYPVQMAKDIQEVKDFVAYYKDTYGLDKFGKEAYTAEDKATGSYKKYCQYRNFRYVLRKEYNSYLTKIAAEADETKRKALLAEGKRALDDASVGKNCNAVVWAFLEKNGVKDIPVMVAVPNDVEDYTKHPSPGTTAHNAMCAAAEALYPGNWTYTYHETNFGAFVNNVSAGGEGDIGCTVIDKVGTTGPNYGFWSYNGQNSDWGVGNYNPYDGDVLIWGGGNVDQYWDWAKLRLYYDGDDDKLAAEAKKRGISDISKATGEKIETAFVDLTDGSGKDFFRRDGQFRDVEDWELVVKQIGAIGSVGPDSGDKITAARTAYDALDTAKQAKVSNLKTLTEAEAAYKALTNPATISADSALAGVLGALQKEELTMGSTKGEWAIISLARGNMMTDAIKNKYIDTVIAELAKADSDEFKQNTSYARAMLALASLGVTAPDKAITNACDITAAKAQGINAVAYALLALDSKPYTGTDVEKIRKQYVDYILSDVCKDGGWILERKADSVADTDITAIVIQALAPYYNSDTAYQHAKVKTAVDNALAAMKLQQKSTGGFEAYGGLYNAESTAQMVVALCSINVDPTTWNSKNAVDALLHFYNTTDGKFKHDLSNDSDDMATEQSAYALVAYSRFSKQNNSLWDMSDAFGEGGAITDPNQAMTAAKLAATAINNDKVAQSVANTEEKVIEYIKNRLTIQGITGASYDVAFQKDGENNKFTAAVAGTADNKAGTDGSFAVNVKITVTGVADPVTIAVAGTITATAYTTSGNGGNGGGGGATSGNITVLFSMYGDDIHEEGAVHTLKQDNLKCWIAETPIEVKSGATVLDVIKKALGSDYTISNPKGNYIKAVTPKGGETLAEFTNGEKSGWMYSLNGHHPTVAVNSQKVASGDVLIFHYTDDYTIEEGSEEFNGNNGNSTTGGGGGSATVSTTVNPVVTVNENGEAKASLTTSEIKVIIKEAKEAGANQIVVAPKISGEADKVTVNIPSLAAKSVGKDANSDLRVETGIVDVVIGKSDLTKLGTAGNLSIVAEKNDDGTVSVTVTANDSALKLTDGNVVVPCENPGVNDVVVIVKADGTEQVIVKSVAGEDCVIAPIDGSRTVKLVRVDVALNDMLKHWGKEAAEFVAARGIFNGTAANTFAPNDKMNRAMVATVLWRLENQPATSGKYSFKDSVDDWAKAAVIWAAEQNIVGGDETGNYNGSAAVTRQELAAMLYRYAKVAGLNTTATADLSKFSDSNSVADWAVDAVKWAVASGLMKGDENGALNPTGTATRAEVATVIMRLIEM